MLSRSLRKLRLLRSLRQLRYLGNHSECKVNAGLLYFLRPKWAVEVIVANDVIISVEITEATEIFRTP